MGADCLSLLPTLPELSIQMTSKSKLGKKRRIIARNAVSIAKAGKAILPDRLPVTAPRMAHVAAKRVARALPALASSKARLAAAVKARKQARKQRISPAVDASHAIEPAITSIERCPPEALTHSDRMSVGQVDASSPIAARPTPLSVEAEGAGGPKPRMGPTVVQPLA